MMLRKTLASVLLCSSLLIPACNKKSEDRMVHTTDQASPVAYDKVAASGSGSGVAVGGQASVNGAYAPSPGLAQDVTSGEGYQDYGKNPWVDASKDHLSTFAADVDTASYSLARRKLLEGQMPVAAGVRVEEFVNYFRYAFPTPQSDSPFSVIMDAAPSPLAPGRHIVRVGVATKAKSAQERKPANLVFLVDVSGSMQSPDKLDLAKKALTTLTMNLGEGDTVSLVTYAGSTRVVLPRTGAGEKSKIIAALDDLVA
ncbi:MAG: von Willebrand factor type A domain-containing protein, partial [Polyangiales bacterium]